MAGLLDFMPGMDTPEGQGLLSAAFSLMSAQKYPGQKGALAGALGDAGKTYLQSSNSSRDAMQRRKFQDAQMQAQQMQIDGQRQKQEMEQKAEVERARIMGLVSNAGRVAPGMGAGLSSADSAALPPEFQTGVTVPALQKPGQIDYQTLFRLGVPLDMLKGLSESSTLGKPKVKNIETVNVGGKPMKIGIDEYGQQVAQIGMEWRPLKTQDMGGYIGTFDETNPGAGVTKLGDKTMTFGDKIAQGHLGVSQANLGIARQRLDMDLGASVTDAGGPSQSAFTKQFGKAGAGYRWKADGSQEFIPGGPADQKALMQKSGEGTVGSVVADLRDKYRQLSEGGGIVDSDNGMLSNLGAAIGASGVGQTFGGAVGTKNQTVRDAVAMTRPLLLQAIMKATGMSAKQMDSNAELKLYLSTATDPQKGLKANLEALDRIEKLYGGGPSKTKSNSGGASGEWAKPKSNGWSIQKE